MSGLKNSITYFKVVVEGMGTILWRSPPLFKLQVYEDGRQKYRMTKVNCSALQLKSAEDKDYGSGKDWGDWW
jgi:hypothetical protein